MTPLAARSLCLGWKPKSLTIKENFSACLKPSDTAQNILYFCDIPYKSQVLLLFLDGLPKANPHNIANSTARGDVAVHHEVLSARGKREQQAVTAASRKHPWEIKG